MVRDVILRSSDGSLSASLPRVMTDRLGLAEGDRVVLREMPEGILITTLDTDSIDAMQFAREAAARYRVALRELAK